MHPSVGFFHGIRRLGGLLAVALCLALPLRAHAHPDLDEGKRLVGELEFEAALAAFSRAVESGQLTREELIQVLSERTLVLHALHRQNELVADFVWLAALSPEFILDMRAPPDLVGVWKSVRDQARGALTVRLIHETAGTHLRLRAELSGTVPSDVQTRIAVRPLGSTEWQTAAGQEQLNVQDLAVEFDAYAEAIGPGGLVVARDGSIEAPLRIKAEVAPKPVVQTDSDAAHKKRRRAWLIGSSAALVVAAAVTSFFLVQNQHDKSPPVQVTPMVKF